MQCQTLNRLSGSRRRCPRASGEQATAAHGKVKNCGPNVREARRQRTPMRILYAFRAVVTAGVLRAEGTAPESRFTRSEKPAWLEQPNSLQSTLRGSPL